MTVLTRSLQSVSHPTAVTDVMELKEKRGLFMCSEVTKLDRENTQSTLAMCWRTGPSFPTVVLVAVSGFVGYSMHGLVCVNTERVSLPLCSAGVLLLTTFYIQRETEHLTAFLHQATGSETSLGPSG